jgi:hypothetical protein
VARNEREVTPKEQEIAIKELEERVDRLRNLYDQYFLGFERLEPTVPRKDVDRRLAILRKEPIRNTAMRFRFNVITQKYNTYAMHWMRICRQIEEGTYKRHVRRAKARFSQLSSTPDRDLSIDIDIDDFDMSMEEVLAEANAAAERFERPPPDTVRRLPPPSEGSPPPSSEPTIPAARTIPATPATALVASAPSPRPADRMARPAALPLGTKPRILVRKREEGDLGPATVRSPAPPIGRPPVAPHRPDELTARPPPAAPSPKQPGHPGPPGSPAGAPLPSYIEKGADPSAPHARPPGARPRAPLRPLTHPERPGPGNKNNKKE